MKKSFVSMLAVSIVASGRAALIRLDRRGQNDQVSLDMQLLVGISGRSAWTISVPSALGATLPTMPLI